MKKLAGVDVGGTFTDLAFWDDERKTVFVHKVLTTPRDATEGIITGFAGLPERPDAIVHGTTLVTNALIERQGARVGLLTTSGFRDTLEMGRELRYDPFDLLLKAPEPLVPRKFRLTVRERVGADGGIVVPLDETGVRAAAREFRQAGIDSIAVAFFNSYRNRAHELRAVDILREEIPGAFICASADIAPELREYDRFSTAAANAYVMPLASRYLKSLIDAARMPVLVMLSDGGVATAQTAMQSPINLVESGPAAGAMMAAHLATHAGWDRVIAFDMGGTTAKLSLVHHGSPNRSHEIEVARVHRFKKGSGLPLRVPVVQLIEIGAGGGSIAWVDSLGLMKVGPRSSGALPGPACYGRGGREATVTDADLVLGYIGAQSFLGGRMPLDVSAAEAALDRLADELHLTRTAAAAGIAEIVENNMATAARIHVAEEGQDPRRYRLLAFGGAGPVHAYGLARILGVSEVIFPRGAGVASAIGMLVAPRSAEFTGSYVQQLATMDWDAVHRMLAELESRGREVLAETGAQPADMGIEPAADMRYVGQGYEITVPLTPSVLREKNADELRRAFNAQYQTRFGRSLGMPVEIVSWRVRVTAAPVADEVRLEQTAATCDVGSIGEREVYFAEARGFRATPVFLRSRLAPGAGIEGPAIIEESESTVVVGPGARVTVDDAGN
ncbi:MAG TPA: hydantoinase/oxoprolinase family protein, partial [Burkholderiales bacterium]|nr:hydantoinase/oxoprolinase family protein [Burkholderiales bacterium]